MPGPPPKHPAQRRRRAAPVHEWKLLSKPYDGPIPELPSWSAFKPTAETLEWWEHIWRTRVATQWIEADVPALVELAWLRQMLVKGDARFASEVRRRADAFGLSPKGRQQLRWLLVDAEGDPEPEHEDEVAERRARRARLTEALEAEKED